MMKLRCRLLINCVAFLLAFHPNLAKADCEEGQIETSHKHVKGSCKNTEPALPQCLPLNTLLILDGNTWKGGPDVLVQNGPSTSIQALDHASGRRITTNAFDYIYVSDARTGIGKGAIGILSKRKSATLETIDTIDLYRNPKPPVDIRIGAKSYDRFHQGERVRMKRTFHDWRDLPEYDGLQNDDATKSQFAYANGIASNALRKSMLLRYTQGGISCVKFQLAHGIDQISNEVMAFKEGEPSTRHRITVRFSQ